MMKSEILKKLKVSIVSTDVAATNAPTPNARNRVTYLI
jgi:hypothetical protein